MKKLLTLIIGIAISSQVTAQAKLLTGAIEAAATNGRTGLQCTLDGKVTYIHPGSPAALAGILPGDQIISVDGIPGDICHIHGDPGTVVTIMVKRGDDAFARDLDRVDQRLILPCLVKSTNLFTNNQPTPAQAQP